MAEKDEKDLVKPSPAEAKAAIEGMQEKLNQVERTTGRSGAIPRTPKQKLLDASDVQAARPNKRVRWVNLKNAEKRTGDGYERIPVADGGRQAGDLALFELDRPEYDRRVAEQKARNKELLRSHETEVERMADEVAKVMRDRHGLSINAEDIIVRG
jgi:hypothetical protein